MIKTVQSDLHNFCLKTFSLLFQLMLAKEVSMKTSWNSNDKLLRHILSMQKNALSFYKSKTILDPFKEILDLSRNCFRQIQDIFSIWIKFSSKTSFLDLVYIENLFWTCTVRPVEGISVLYDFCLRHFSLLFSKNTVMIMNKL